MAQQITVEIMINGKAIAPFSSLSLRQQFNGHHSFELKFNHDVLEEKFAVTLNQSKNYLGKSINITFKTLSDGSTAQSFKGIVTDIGISNSLSSPGDLIFKGFSPTIMLETGENNKSYLEQTLSQVVKDACLGVPSNDLPSSVSPVKTAAIPYIVQYRESNFAFIRRLAAQYGEWFYYDGAGMKFGKPADGQTVQLSYPNDISDLNLQVRLAPVKFDQLGYLSKQNQKITAASSGQQVAGLDLFGKHALSVSEQVFSAKTSNLAQRKFKVNSEANEAAKVAKSTAAASFVILNASSDSPKVKIGAPVQITASGKDYGTFTVTSVSHYTDGIGNYHNEFEGIPSSVAVVPNEYHDKPLAEPQIAMVTDNKDPENMGRVKVRMLWQVEPATTPFIRVLTPHAGTYKDGKKTRGMFFTPEIEDYVIVGFTQNDPDRPFVMGSLPHGQAIDSAPNSDNFIKSIATRSGSIITFHDKDNDKEQEIRIQTDDKNYLSINVKNADGSIKIFSSKSIEVNSKEEIIVKSGKSIAVHGDKTITVKSEKISIEATDTISLKANKKIELSAMDVTIEGSKGVEVKGGATMKIEGAQTEIKGTATAKISGALLNLEASAMANLKGAIVKIN